MKIELAIEQSVIEQYPDMIVGGFIAQFDQPAVFIEETHELTKMTLQEMQQLGCKIETLASEPRIAAWREAFKRSGLKPSTFKGSVEQLARRILRGDSISTPLPLVNLYCGVSAKHLAPLGGYDCALLPEPHIVVRHARPETDRFTPLAGRREDMPLLPTVVVYATGNEIICFGFNHRDSVKTCLQVDTRIALFCSEAIAPVHQTPTRNALAELRRYLLSKQAKVGEIGLIDKATTNIELSL